ncbi:MAG: sensor domain-containing diguanylate cyclase [Humidesulfovibrio sp.]|uniref:sensor domain-containing diguanylate cyclase n=1 Tax=Humidesulfovibrio sp. TaxID=2910988 RepID=UPI002733AE74|nr:sensor domain-containing diguanylate cyclase [Humidesulfovibrio sp.]MDP2847708.1 sensor domain-containing diguanylate cyclase [Humidesulfovibrio sp.]
MKPDFYKDILDNLFDGIYFVDQSRRLTYWNRGAERISGYKAEEVLGRNCASNILKHITQDGEELCNGGCPLAQTLADGQPREADVFLHHKSGHRVPVAVRISPILDESQTIVGAVEIFSDATSRVRLMSELNELKSQTQADPLTGLGNRRCAGLEFKRRMSELQRGNQPFGLLFVDIDNFKAVNDDYGHDVGDRVLAMVAKTLKSALRGVDTVCRWGGEEFVALVPKVDEQVFQAVAERMRRFVEVTPIPVNGDSLSVTVSVGGSLAKSTDTLTSLAARADAMMYAAKHAGKNRVSLDCGPQPL